MIKKQKLFTLIILVSFGMMLTACAKNNAEQAPEQTETAAETESTVEETENTEPEMPEDETASSEEIAPEESADVSEKIQFTVDVTDNLADENGMIIGNTSSAEGYCGIVEIHMDEALLQRAAEEIQTGKTYVFTVKPMMTMSIPPQIIATDFALATEEEINRLEEVRKTISNYKDCMETYKTMSLEEIIQDANFSYALWTQEEIGEFLEFIAEKGYTDDSDIKCYVKQRADLNGSVPGGA